jgi:hypothetical protein
MKRILALIVTLMMLAAAPAYGISFLDKVVCKKVRLPYQTMCLLVNRFTGKAEYIGEGENWIKISTLPPNKRSLYQQIADKAVQQ